MKLRTASIAENLITLPAQAKDTQWPTQKWARGSAPASADAVAEDLFNLTPAQGVTYGLVVIKNGELVYEKYGAGANAFYLQYSWSMAKSITHALFGILVRQGRVDIYDRAPVVEWKDDERAEITIDQLLRMSSGLKFNEDYVDGGLSDVIPMLQTEGRHDMGKFAAEMPLTYPPGTQWSYSSGTTNILCRILKDIVGGGASGMLQFMNDELFEPIGMRTATPKFDTSGTFIGSSFLFATPQDFARFGLLYLRGGSWDGREIVSPQWVDYARSPTYKDDAYCYGAQWWMDAKDISRFYCGGYDGQRILCVPQKDMIVVRCGRTPEAEAPYLWGKVNELIELF
jgi:CubicO group peptidase (beta-lactamase class C family)